MKVIGIGFQKTGTTTLDEALRILGYNVTGPNLKLAKSLLNNDLTEAMEIAERFEALQDNPWPILYTELDKKFPDSKFILTCRDDEKWYASVLNHFGKDKTKMRQWIYNEASPFGNESIYRKVFNDHYRGVRHYFKNRPNNLLEIDWSQGHGWKELCEFLDKPIPNQPFPHSNKRTYENTIWKKAEVNAKNILIFLGLR